MLNIEKAAPPGATDEEVADDITAKVSDGEFIIPANVVRFIGLDKLRGMVTKAEEKLGEMGDEGLIGGEEDEEGIPGFAEGGLVTAPTPPANPLSQAGFSGIKTFTNGKGGVLKIPMINGRPAITPPPGYEMNDNAQAVTTGDETKEDREEGGGTGGKGVTGMAGAVDQWSVDNFSNYNKQLSDRGTRAFTNNAISTLMGPMGKLASKSRQNYLEEAVPKALEKMLTTQKDMMGNPLNAQQVTDLQGLQTTLTSQMQKDANKRTLGTSVRGFWDTLTDSPGTKGESFKSVASGVTYDTIGNSKTGAFSSRTAIGSTAPTRSSNGGNGTGGRGHSADKSPPSRSDAGTSKTGSRGDKNDPRG